MMLHGDPRFARFAIALIVCCGISALAILGVVSYLAFLALT